MSIASDIVFQRLGEGKEAIVTVTIICQCYGFGAEVGR